jgi:hypothetical protein
LIDRYCIENSVFQDRITIHKEYICFTGKWYGHSPNLKWAIIQSTKNIFWKFLFYLFAECSYDMIIKNMFDKITIKEYGYTPICVQLIRTNGSGGKKSKYYQKYNDGRFWYCSTINEHCYIKRSENWSVTKCLSTLS